ncbi:esterase family protein [Massilia kyonggiensis]|nr:esterase family protein [Massilia kyonggiensis]
MERRCFLLATAACLAGCGGGNAAVQQTAPAVPAAAAGTVETLAVASRALGRTMNVALYLPPGGARHPILYLFHGFGGNGAAFFDAGLAINRAADRLGAPLVIAAPDYDNGFGVNTTPAQGTLTSGGTIGLYEDYLMTEMLPAVESRLGVTATRADRRIGGVSMGGFAALHLALRHPEMFSRVGAHSAALWDYSSADQFTGQRDWLYPTPALRAQRDPLLLAAHADLRGLRFYLDVGDRDPLRRQDEAMQAVLGAASELHVGSGGHDAAFWRSRLESWLAFYGAA